MCSANQEEELSTRNRWALLLAGLLSVALVFAAACGDDDDNGDTTPTGQTPTNGNMAPPDQQRIVIQSAEPAFYDPHRSNFEADIAVERMIFRGLYKLVDDGSGGVDVEPELADGEPSVDGSTYTVTLREDLRWSDGEPLTAEHFVFGFQRACNPETGSPYGYLLAAGYLDVVGCNDLQMNEDPEQADALLEGLGVSAPDDQTVVIELNEPNDFFTTIMSLWITFPARQDVIEEHGERWTDPENIVVNGPFTISELRPGEFVRLVPNPEWTAGQTPVLQEIEIAFIDNLSEAYRNFANDELDMTRIQAADVVAAEGDSDLADQIVILPTARITSVQMQLNNEVLADLNVRIALSRAIDRDELNEVVFDGSNTPATYWVVQGVHGHLGNDEFDDVIGYDPDAARAALEEAGYPDGQGFPQFSIILTDTEQNRNLADFLIDSWSRELGITVNPEFMDGRSRIQRFLDEDFEIFIGGWQLDYPDIGNPLLGLFETDGPNNFYNCADEEIDAAFDAAIAAQTPEERIEAFQEVERLIISKVCGVAPIYQDSLPFLVNRNLGGVTPNGIIDAGQPGNHCVECWYVRAN